MKKYQLLSLLFFFLSLLGSLYLVKNNQDNRNRAATTPSIECRKDFPEICPNLHNPNPLYDEMVGRYRGQNDCTFFDACARDVEAGQSCAALTRLSQGEADHGAFVGCNSSRQNCFCNFDFSGNVRCFDDRLSDSCAARIFPAASTSTPVPTTPPTLTPTPLPSQSPTPTKKPTSTPTPTNTPAPSTTPTSTPVPTSTPIPTATSTPVPTATSTPAPSSTPIPTVTSTPAPSSTPVPTRVISSVDTPTPTRIILPQSGIEFPSQILTLLGAIVTLFGFLILL